MGKVNDKMAFFATGNSFADALTGTVYAAKLKAPIILVEERSNATQKYVKAKALNLSNVKILGGTGAVPETLVQFYLSDHPSTSGGKVPASQPEVFKGYFENPDYSRPENFLYSGEQTKATSEILTIANSINDNQDISTIRKIMKWMRSNLKVGDEAKFERTAAQNISERKFRGCTDMAITFASIARDKGIPSIIIQTGRIDWIERIVKDPGDTGGIIGHQLVEVLLKDGQWYLVDSTAGKLYFNYNKDNLSLPDGYYVFAKGTEIWDTGVKIVNKIR